ncbi:tautomerase family protein [Rhodoligotrophos ferricapiens]|uniref:tautomerase family protein n=1 Tax=Rhodoligotrophos ferricapiens TaxID=3069264 RepID=UPI00315D33A6
MPILKVELFAGRSREKKRELVKALTDTYVAVLGGKPEAVTIILRDVDKGDWAVAGQLYADTHPDAPAAGDPAASKPSA